MKWGIGEKAQGDIKELQIKFRRLAGDIKNRRPLMNRIGIQLLNAVTANFDEQGHEGQAWEPLRERTIAARRKGRGSGTARILEHTGDLRRSFVPESTNDTIRVGTPKIYAPTHEFGRQAIPKRSMLPSKRYGLQIAIEVAESYIAEKAREAKLT